MKRKKYNWVLPKSIEDRLGSKTYGHQRNIFEDNHLLIILHEPPKIDQMIRDHIVYYRKPTGHLWCNGQDNGSFKIRQLLEQYQTIFDRLEDNANDARSAKDYFSVLEELIPVSSSIQNLAETLRESRRMVPMDDLLLEIRDWSSDLQRSYEMLLQDCRLALDFQTAQKSEDQANKSNQALVAQNRLNTLAAFTFPIMSIATVFGMNMVSGLEHVTPLLFWGVLLAGIGIGFWIQKWLFKGQGN